MRTRTRHDFESSEFSPSGFCLTKIYLWLGNTYKQNVEFCRTLEFDVPFAPPVLVDFLVEAGFEFLVWRIRRPPSCEAPPDSSPRTVCYNLHAGHRCSGS